MNILSYNPYYTYENIDLWSSDTWEARVSPLHSACGMRICLMQ